MSESIHVPGATQVKSICMDESEIERTLTRIAHQILEANNGAEQRRELIRTYLGIIPASTAGFYRN